MSGPFEPATIGADDTFQLSGLFGSNTVQVIGLPGPWIVKAIHYRETDIFGRAVEMKSSSDPSQLRVVLTNRSATLTGRVEILDARDPATVRVLFYPVDLPSRADLSGIMCLDSRPATMEGSKSPRFAPGITSLSRCLMTKCRSCRRRTRSSSNSQRSRSALPWLKGKSGRLV